MVHENLLVNLINRMMHVGPNERITPLEVYWPPTQQRMLTTNLKPKWAPALRRTLGSICWCSQSLKCQISGKDQRWSAANHIQKQLYQLYQEHMTASFPLSAVKILPQIRLVKKTQMNQGETLCNATSRSTAAFFTTWSECENHLLLSPRTWSDFFLFEQQFDVSSLTRIYWHSILGVYWVARNASAICSCVLFKLLLIRSKETSGHMWLKESIYLQPTAKATKQQHSHLFLQFTSQ